MAIIMLRHSVRRFAQLTLNPQSQKAIYDSFFAHFKTTPNMASVLRFAWHDAGTFDAATKTGGPNGSLRFDKELAHGANTGLAPIRDLFQAKKAEFPDVNWADLIQAGGMAAVVYSGGPKMDCVFGRTEAQSDSECPPEGRLPDASKGADHLREVFGRMGLSDVDIVALSGGHTLGRANKHKEGDYEGFWTKTPTLFNNEYFIVLLTKPPGLLRLPTDIALVSDRKFKKVVEDFALNEDRFFAYYAIAHTKLATLGYALP